MCRNQITNIAFINGTQHIFTINPMAVIMEQTKNKKASHRHKDKFKSSITCIDKTIASLKLRGGQASFNTSLVLHWIPSVPYYCCRICFHISNSSLQAYVTPLKAFKFKSSLHCHSLTSEPTINIPSPIQLLDWSQWTHETPPKKVDM